MAHLRLDLPGRVTTRLCRVRNNNHPKPPGIVPATRGPMWPPRTAQHAGTTPPPTQRGNDRARADTLRWVWVRAVRSSYSD